MRCVRFLGHTAWAPEGRNGRSQGGPKGRKLEVGARRAPKLLVVNIVVLNCQECYQRLKCQVSGQSLRSKSFPKIWKISKNLKKKFQKMEFSKINFFGHLKIFRSGHVRPIIAFITCLKGQKSLRVLWKFSENLKFFRKSENFPKLWNIWKSQGNLKSCQGTARYANTQIQLWSKLPIDPTS